MANPGRRRRRSRKHAVLITSAPVSAEEDLSRRQMEYLALMSLRVICFIAAIFLHGVWRWIAVGGAAFLPGIAVLIANAIDLRARRGNDVPTVTQQFRAIEAPPRPEPPIIISGDTQEIEPTPDPPRPGSEGPDHGEDADGARGPERT